MPRQVRIQFPGALYHVMCRGDRREAIFKDDEDREIFLKTLAEAARSNGWLVHAYVLMGNHYHLLLETPEPNLVAGMTWFQTTYTVRYNARHRTSGHVFGGRYKAIITEGGAGSDYYRTLLDYIHLNPVRASLVKFAADVEPDLLQFRWSSLTHYAATASKRPPYLRTREAFPTFRPERRASRAAQVCREAYRPRAQRKEEIVRAGRDRGARAAIDAPAWLVLRERMLALAETALEKFAKQPRSVTSYSSREMSDHGEKEAARILKAGLEAYGIKPGDLRKLSKGHPVRTGNMGYTLTGHMGNTLNWAHALEYCVTYRSKTTFCHPRLHRALHCH